ncbi:MAG TPA: hypothetical protein VMU25_04465 [Candidatus Paceibacterota bacterium]|nr:hypothetical protein [Candidatus Paceibacterota bacterium]
MKNIGVRKAAIGTVLGVFLVLGSLSLLYHDTVAGLLAAAAASLKSAPARSYFMPVSGIESLDVGSSTDIDFDIDASVPINAVGATISFPKDKIEIVGISKAKSFLNLWTEDTEINEDAGTLHFSGGTTVKGGMVGTSTALTITVRAKSSGQAQLVVDDLQVLAADGQGTSLATDTRSVTLSIAPAQETQVSVASAAPAPKAPSPDLNNDGMVNLLDVSILVFKMVGPYDPRFDLDLDGKIGLSDLSVIFSHMGKVTP